MNPSYSLVLGTAQFGSSYGIANAGKTGQPDQITVNAIVQEAWENGIQEFDTAQGYGKSEQVLGEALSKLGVSTEVLIISKFDPALDHLNGSVLSNAMGESLSRLGIPSFYGMMLHKEEMLSAWDNGLSKIFHTFVVSGKIKHIGISVYSPEKAIQALNTDGIDMVQLPTNILDRRFERAGVFQLAEEKKKKIYIRSVFLQGLILMDADEIPEKMSFAKPVIEELESISNELKLSRKKLALDYIKSEMPDAKVVFGADTPLHVKENVACWEGELLPSSVDRVKKIFDCVDEKILNPTLWPD
ncbi:MAG: aldo/keto reductase [Candidatus Scalindua sp.]|nr:aldo/keto reductase [Candidatus Scalindua sp.]